MSKTDQTIARLHAKFENHLDAQYPPIPLEEGPFGASPYLASTQFALLLNSAVQAGESGPDIVRAMDRLDRPRAQQMLSRVKKYGSKAHPLELIVPAATCDYNMRVRPSMLISSTDAELAMYMYSASATLPLGLLQSYVPETVEQAAGLLLQPWGPAGFKLTQAQYRTIAMNVKVTLEQSALFLGDGMLSELLETVISARDHPKTTPLLSVFREIVGLKPSIYTLTQPRTSPALAQSVKPVLDVFDLEDLPAAAVESLTWCAASGKVATSSWMTLVRHYLPGLSKADAVKMHAVLTSLSPEDVSLQDALSAIA